MNRRVKKVLVIAFLACVGIAGYQIWEFFSHYNQVRDTLEYLLHEEFATLGPAEFRHRLIREVGVLGVDLDPLDIEIIEDKPKRAVRVEFRYTWDMHILVFSFPREMIVWRSLRDVDLIG